MVRNTLVREFGFYFPLPVGRDMLLCDRIDIFLKFPSAMIVVKSLPFAKIFHIAIDSFSVRNNALDIAESFKVFLLSFLFEQKSFPIFLRDSKSIDA